MTIKESLFFITLAYISICCTAYPDSYDTFDHLIYYHDPAHDGIYSQKIIQDHSDPEYNHYDDGGYDDYSSDHHEHYYAYPEVSANLKDGRPKKEEQKKQPKNVQKDDDDDDDDAVSQKYTVYEPDGAIKTITFTTGKNGYRTDVHTKSSQPAYEHKTSSDTKFVSHPY